MSKKKTTYNQNCLTAYGKTCCVANVKILSLNYEKYVFY